MRSRYYDDKIKTDDIESEEKLKPEEKKKGEEKDAICHKCEMNELVKNGGFEIAGVIENSFQFWVIEVTEDQAIISATDDSFEGRVSAQFSTEDTNNEEEKRGRIFQVVKITPGCLYRLSFAESLQTGENRPDFRFGELTARVYYTDNEGIKYNLIKVLIRVTDDGLTSTGFKYHQKVAAAVVPINVSDVTVEFSFLIKDSKNTIGNDSYDEWMIDGVSLRSEFAIQY